MVAVLVAVPFFFLNSNLKHPEDANWLDKLVLQASGPIQYVATVVARSVSEVVEEYVWVVDVHRENAVLARETDQLKQELRELRAISQENERLRKLLGLRDRVRGQSVAARVVGRTASPHSFRITRIRIDRGQRDLVRSGMPVVNADGLVGEVLRTAGRYGDVRLTVDPDSKVDVVVGRNGARGILRGTANNRRYVCRIEYLTRQSEVQVDDEVHTSGLGTKYPEGILVGRIVSVSREETGLYQEVEVEPVVNFSSIDEVLVLTGGSREQESRGSRTDVLLEDR